MAAGAAEAIAEVDRLVGKAEYIAAFDLASRHLAAFPDNETLKHRGVLALARAGATDRAMQRFREWRLDRSEDTDALSLEGRLLKDQALKLEGAARRAGLLAAADSYRHVFEKKPSLLSRDKLGEPDLPRREEERRREDRQACPCRSRGRECRRLLVACDPRGGEHPGRRPRRRTPRPEGGAGGRQRRRPPPPRAASFAFSSLRKGASRPRSSASLRRSRRA